MLINEAIEKLGRAGLICEDHGMDPEERAWMVTKAVAGLWLDEFKKQLPKGFRAEYVVGNNNVTGISDKTPNINIYNDNYKPTGQISLPCCENPRNIAFENCYSSSSFKDLKGVQVAIHYPGVRRMADRFTLPQEYNIEKTVANIIKDFVK